MRDAFETAQVNAQLRHPKMKVSWITGPKLFTNSTLNKITVLGATTFLPCRCVCARAQVCVLHASCTRVCGVCVLVCVFTYALVCFAGMFLCAHVLACVRVNVPVHVCVRVFHVCVYVCMILLSRFQMCTHMRICEPACMRLHPCVRMLVFVSISLCASFCN